MSSADAGLFRHPFSWRSRIFRATVGLILLVLAVRLVWGWQSRRELEAKLAELRREGLPVSRADLTNNPRPGVRDASVFQPAAAALAPGVDSPANSTLTYGDAPPYPAAWWQLAEASERANAKAFSLARQARLSTGPANSTGLPALNATRALAVTIGDGAVYSHLKGNDVEAIDRTMDVLLLGRSLREQDTQISQLVGIGIDALVQERIKVIAPGLFIRRDAQTAATRTAVEGLIRQILNEDFHWQAITQSLVTETAISLDRLRSAAALTWFIRPLADQQGVRDIRNLRFAVDASRTRFKPRANAVLAKIDATPPDQFITLSATPPHPRYSRRFDMSAGAYASRYIEVGYRVLADRRCTAVSLAAQLYRADHDGAWPAALSDLVPRYLPSVPADPYHDDGRPLGYEILRLPDGTQRPVVYFDAGATDGEIRPQPLYDWHEDYQPDPNKPFRHRDVRQYRDLSRFAPPPSPPKAVDDDPGITY